MVPPPPNLAQLLSVLKTLADRVCARVPPSSCTPGQALVAHCSVRCARPISAVRAPFPCALPSDDVDLPSPRPCVPELALSRTPRRTLRIELAMAARTEGPPTSKSPPLYRCLRRASVTDLLRGHTTYTLDGVLPDLQVAASASSRYVQRASHVRCDALMPGTEQVRPCPRTGISESKRPLRPARRITQRAPFSGDPARSCTADPAHPPRVARRGHPPTRRRAGPPPSLPAASPTPPRAPSHTSAEFPSCTRKIYLSTLR